MATIELSMAANPMFHSRTKHFELDLCFVKEKVCQKQIQVYHNPSHAQIVDALTKAVSSAKFHDLIVKLNSLSPFNLSLRGPMKELIQLYVS